MSVISSGPILLRAVAAALAIVVLFAHDLPAQGSKQDGGFAPLAGVAADPKIPTLKSAVGFGWGEDITSHSQIERYLQALAQADPDRVRLIEYGKSWEGRPLSLLVLSSADRMKNLDRVKRDNGRLADPRSLSDEEAKALAESAPAIVWLAYGVHGDETSSPDAALATAYSLLADPRPEARRLLERLVVIIDPSQNPDGRDRFVNAYREARGAFPQSEPLASERGKRWAPGRLNHYWFDLNRDWIHQTQIETQAKAAAYLQWQPQIFVDAHEMGGEATYFFNPASDPINEFVTPVQREWSRKIGEAHAEWFDERGFSYTTREIFDDFFPGYGSSWPTMQGGIGILWEQAGVRGLAYDREDRTTLKYEDAVKRHFASGMATLAAASSFKTDLLRDFRRARADAIALGRDGPVKDFVLLEGKRPLRAERLARTLIRNGIEVDRLTSPIRVGDREWPAGGYRVSVAQPAGRLVRTLLDREAKIPQAFRDRQLDREQRGLAGEFYDITAWSLPLAFDVEAVPVADRIDWSQIAKRFDPAAADRDRAAAPETPAARVAYLVPPEDDGATLALTHWLREGLRVHVADQPIKVRGVSFAKGTLILKVNENVPDPLRAALRFAERECRLSATPVDSGFVEQGAHFGGPDVHWVKPPRILLLVDRPVHPLSVGAAWRLFDREWRYPVARVEVRDLPRLELAKFDVVVLSDGDGYAEAVNAETLARIREWVREGGTLICAGKAAAWACDPKVALIKTEPIRKPETETDSEGSVSVKAKGDDDKTDEAKSQRSSDDSKPPRRSSGGESDDPSLKSVSTENAELAAQRKTRAPRRDADRQDEDREDGQGKGEREEPEPPHRVPGAFLRATAYDDHWMTFGLGPDLPILYSGDLLLRPFKPRHGRNVVTFNPRDRLLISGFLWPESPRLIAETPYAGVVDLGKGHIVVFADDPNFRAYSPAAQRLFFNACFFGPAH